MGERKLGLAGATVSTPMVVSQCDTDALATKPWRSSPSKLGFRTVRASGWVRSGVVKAGSVVERSKSSVVVSITSSVVVAMSVVVASG